jgi:Flp pilus assembly protein TadG
MRARLSALLARWGLDRSGVAAVEFAFTVPVLLVVYLAGFEISQAMATYRKVSDTTIELANVAAQYTTMATLDITSVMNASSQIMAPYPTQNLSIVLSEITTDDANNATVTWSQASNGATPLTPGTNVTLPAGLGTKDTSYILVTTTYLYVPIAGANFIGPIPMTDQIYMLPRASASIPCTDCTAS